MTELPEKCEPGWDAWLPEPHGLTDRVPIGDAKRLAHFPFGIDGLEAEFGSPLAELDDIRFLQDDFSDLVAVDEGGRPRPDHAEVILTVVVVRLGARCFIVRSPIDPHVLDAVARFLADRDDTLRASAVTAVAAFGPAAAGRVPQLLERLGDSVPAVRAAAARALGTLKPLSADVVVELARLLTDRDVSDAAAEALHAYGAGAAPALPKLLDALERALAGQADPALYLSLLRAISSDPVHELREHFGQRDPDQLRFALRELKRIS